MLLHNHGMGNGQALPGTLSDLLGGEERIEDLGLNLLRNPGAGIDDADFNERIFPPRR